MMQLRNLPGSSNRGSWLRDWRAWQVVVWLVMFSSWLGQGLSGSAVNSDGISYLDIASACIKGNWGALINGVWSPFYAVLLSFWLFLFRPSAGWEAHVVRLFEQFYLRAQRTLCI